MGDEQGGPGVLSPEAATAVEAEVARIIRAAEAEAGRTYRPEILRPYAYKILRETVPGFTRDRWREITNRDADTRLDPQGQAQAERERRQRDQERAQVARDARELLRQHGRPTCCPECDVPAAEELRAELDRQRGPELEPAAPELDHPERTCECDRCEDEHCQGTCEPCDDHGCRQCHPDGCPDTYECCGYCEECDAHTGDSREEVCDRGYCHECNHEC